MNFHKKLNEYIQMLPCTAKELSELSGLSAATLSRYRSGERVPDMRSSAFSQLCSAIARISEQKGNSTLTADAVRESFLSCEDLVTVDREQLRYNFNTLISLLNINISRLCQYTNYDTSTIFRFRSGSRQIAEPEKFAAVIAGYIAKEMDSASEKAVLAELFGCTAESLADPSVRFQKLQTYLLEAKGKREDSVSHFLSKLEFLFGIMYNTIQVDDSLTNKRIVMINHLIHRRNFIMAVKVAINGFGRIGRLAFRQMFGAEGFEIVAINDLTSPKMLAHLLKYDTKQKKYALADTVTAGEDSITVDGKEIKIYAKANAAELPWGEIGVDVVLECTGFYTSKDKAQAHIDAGAKHVIISAPAGNDLKTIVYNVNHETLTKEDHIISAASCTTNCLAPMAKALNDLAAIKSGIMCTIHAYTGDQMTLDGPQRKGDLRRSRAAAVNIVPNSTGAAKAIGLVIPELNGKLIGSAQRVPTPTGSTTILTAVVEGNVTKEQINAAMKAASNESFGYNEDEIVSSDIVGMRFGSLFDATQTMVLPLENGTTEVQVVSWYDNENSYTSQMVRTIKHFGKLLNA